jgi:endonuclease/exonuclease/phosphatase family metal-dependent hydrolase
VIAQVIANLDADVIALQEIVSLEELRRVLDWAGELTSRTYEMRDANGAVLGTGQAAGQKVVMAYDAQRYDLLAASPIYGGVSRLPFAIRVRGKAGEDEATIVGVHFKSGQPQFDDQPSAETRLRQCQHIAGWVAGDHRDQNLAFPQPQAGEHVVIMGDFNAISALRPGQPEAWSVVVHSLDPLRQGAMENWIWEDAVPDPTGGGPATSYLENLLIDHAVLSPSLAARVRQKPTIYAFDHDTAVTEKAVHGVAYRVSDHRPVTLEVDATAG